MKTFSGVCAGNLPSVQRRNLLLGSVAAWLVLPRSVLAQTSVLSSPAAERLNTAAMQRMLSQRIAKAYAQVLANVLVPQATEILTSSVARFNSNLNLLRGSGLPAEALRLLGELERVSAPLIAAAGAPPIREKAEAVHKSSEEALAVAEALLKALPANNAAGASLISLAGRQRMLSQRAAKMFFLYQLGIRSPEIKSAFDRSLKDFEAVLSEFKVQAEEYPEVRDEVELASVQMEFFKTSARALEGLTEAQKITVARSNERLLETMDALTKELIAKFAARELSSAPPAAPKKAR